MEIRVAVDTNRLSDLFRGDLSLAHLLARCREVWIPLPVFAELRAGFLGGTRSKKNDHDFREFLARPNVSLLLPGRETGEHYARLLADLRREGTPIPANDLWIAALALEHDLRLITRDRHFERIPQLLLG